MTWQTGIKILVALGLSAAIFILLRTRNDDQPRPNNFIPKLVETALRSFEFDQGQKLLAKENQISMTPDLLPLYKEQFANGVTMMSEYLNALRRGFEARHHYDLLGPAISIKDEGKERIMRREWIDVAAKAIEERKDALSIHDSTLATDDETKSQVNRIGFNMGRLYVINNAGYIVHGSCLVTAKTEADREECKMHAEKVVQRLDK